MWILEKTLLSHLSLSVPTLMGMTQPQPRGQFYEDDGLTAHSGWIWCLRDPGLLGPGIAFVVGIGGAQCGD